MRRQHSGEGFLCLTGCAQAWREPQQSCVCQHPPTVIFCSGSRGARSPPQLASSMMNNGCLSTSVVSPWWRTLNTGGVRTKGTVTMHMWRQQGSLNKRRKLASGSWKERRALCLLFWPPWYSRTTGAVLHFLQLPSAAAAGSSINMNLANECLRKRPGSPNE